MVLVPSRRLTVRLIRRTQSNFDYNKLKVRESVGFVGYEGFDIENVFLLLNLPVVKLLD